MTTLTIKDLARATQEQIQAKSERLKAFLTKLMQQKLVYSSKQYDILTSTINTLLHCTNMMHKSKL